MLILSEGVDIRAGWFGMEETRKDLGNVGIEGDDVLRFCGLVLSFAWTLAFGERFIEGVGGIIEAESPTRNGCMGGMIDEDLVMWIPPVERRPDDLDAPCLEMGNQGAKVRWLPFEGPIDALPDGRLVINLLGIGVMKFFIQPGKCGPTG